MKNKVNIFDIFAVAMIVAILVLGIWAWKFQPKASNRNVVLTFKTTTPAADLILSAAQSQKQVYFNNTNTLVKVGNVTTDGDSLIIKLEAPGKVAENNDIFNGQRVLIGQKGEIHGNYFAQGVITNISNESF